MSIQTIKQNVKNHVDVFATHLKRVVRRTMLTCVLTATVAVGAVTYVGYVAVPHLHNIYSAAKLIDGEARGESKKGQKAVFSTILERKAEKKFPDSMHGVIYQPYTRNKNLLQYNAMGDDLHEDLSTELGQTILIRTAWWYVLDQFGLFYAPKEAHGAHSYCTPEACERQKGYFGTLKRIGQIGHHVFFGDCDCTGVQVAENKNTAPKTSVRPKHRPKVVPQSVGTAFAPKTSVRPKPRPINLNQSIVLTEQVAQQIEINQVIAQAFAMAD